MSAGAEESQYLSKTTFCYTSWKKSRKGKNHSEKAKGNSENSYPVCKMFLFLAQKVSGKKSQKPSWLKYLGRCEGRGRLGRDSAEASQRRPYPGRGIMKQFYAKNQFHVLSHCQHFWQLFYSKSAKFENRKKVPNVAKSFTIFEFAKNVIFRDCLPGYGWRRTGPDASVLGNISITINVPVGYMARDVMILDAGNSVQAIPSLFYQTFFNRNYVHFWHI